MPFAPGTPVVAVRDATATTVSIYGRGTYLGRRTVPYWDPDLPFGDGGTWREQVTAQVAAERSQPRREFIHRGVATGLDQFGNPMHDARTPEEQVAERLDRIAANPCVDLGAGRRVYGYMCWWMSEPRFEVFAAGRVVTEVAVPDPLPHSMLTA